MRPLSRFVVACVAIASIAACSDDVRHPLAPSSPSDVFGVPIPIPRYDPSFAEIAAGAQHACVRRHSGQVYCWGSDVWGQTGAAWTVICGEPVYYNVCVPQPTQVQTSSFTYATAITAGDAHTCALTSGGGVWCWGLNRDGQIGNGQKGTNLLVASPILVSGTDSYVGVAAGASQTCGVTTTHLLMCWGNDTGYTHLTPTLYSWNANWSGGISLGHWNACALSLSGWWGCWGDNSSGQLSADPSVWPELDGPITSPATTTARRVREGNGFICADQANGTIACLGNNGMGQLGTASFQGSATTIPQVVGGGMPLHNVTAGYTHACALDATGAAFCWGNNSEGALGIGSVGGVQRNPTPVVGGHLFRDISAGTDFTCGIATDNHVYCWGLNDFDQLGQPAAPQHGQGTPVQAIDPS